MSFGNYADLSALPLLTKETMMSVTKKKVKFDLRSFDIIDSFMRKFDMFVSLCRNILDRKSVLTPKKDIRKARNYVKTNW